MIRSDARVVRERSLSSRVLVSPWPRQSSERMPAAGRSLRIEVASSANDRPEEPTFDPIPWQTHFSQSLYLSPPDDAETVFHAYLTPPLAGGPLFVTHHGAGSSGLSFAP